jgi:hypothetical protein
MARGEPCGHHYGKACAIALAGHLPAFDNVACAMQALAPRREHCGCRIIGRGVEADGPIDGYAHGARP